MHEACHKHYIAAIATYNLCMHVLYSYNESNMVIRPDPKIKAVRDIVSKGDLKKNSE